MENRHCIEIQWSVEGVRELAEERNAFLARCNVVINCVENFEWKLLLDMRCGKLTVSIGTSTVPVPIQSLAVEWRACLVTADGERWKSRPHKDYIPPPRNSSAIWNSWALATSAELLDHEKELLCKGLARLSVRIRPTALDLSHTCTYFARSKVGVSREITWKVEGFSSIGSSTDVNKKWLYPLQKVSTDKDENKMEMRLSLKDKKLSLYIGMDPEIETVDWDFCGVIVEEVSIMRFDGSKEECWKRQEANSGIPRDSTIAFVETQKLVDDKKDLLPGDVLTLYAKFRDFNNFPICYAGEMVEGVNPAFPILSADPQMESTSSLSHDMDAFLESGVQSDFTLRAGGEEFPVLKGVLCARSPVFCAMLGSPAWLESARKSMDVPDFGPDVVRRMVRYIYSDRVPERMDTAATAELYAIADQYALPGLRAHCGRLLTRDLRAGTACVALRLAERHYDSDLKARVRAYMRDHQREVFFSPEWAELMMDDPPLALEVEHELHLKRFKPT